MQVQKKVVYELKTKVTSEVIKKKEGRRKKEEKRGSPFLFYYSNCRAAYEQQHEFFFLFFFFFFSPTNACISMVPLQRADAREFVNGSGKVAQSAMCYAYAAMFIQRSSHILSCAAVQ